MKPVRLSDKFTLFSEHWTPKIVAELNENNVLIAKSRALSEWRVYACFYPKGTGVNNPILVHPESFNGGASRCGEANYSTASINPGKVFDPFLVARVEQRY